MSSMFFAVLLSFACLADAEPGWHVGWGFQSHGGFPPLPPSWQTYHMNKSGVGYFLGNASGMDSDAELHAEARLGIAGVGWQVNNIPSHYSNLEEYELETARQLKQMRPGVKVMLTRDTEVTTVFYNMSKKVMYDPSTQDYWTQCGGKPCKGTWGAPAGNTDKYFFNFSNPRFVDWWVNEFIVGTVMKAPDLIDGIYFDCSCGAPPGDHLDQDKMQADAQVAFDRAISQLAAMGKWASAWNTFDGVFQSGPLCATDMRRWIKKYQTDTHTFQQGMHQHAVLDQDIAAFLIARGKSAVLNFPTLGVYGSATQYTWNPRMDVDYGEPLGAGVEGPTGVFTRQYSKATISLDCNKYTASFQPKSGSTESATVSV